MLPVSTFLDWKLEPALEKKTIFYQHIQKSYSKTVALKKTKEPKSDTSRNDSMIRLKLPKINFLEKHRKNSS